MNRWRAAWSALSTGQPPSAVRMTEVAGGYLIESSAGIRLQGCNFVDSPVSLTVLDGTPVTVQDCRFDAPGGGNNLTIQGRPARSQVVLAAGDGDVWKPMMEDF